MTTDEIKNSGNFTMTGVKIEHSDAGFYYMHTTDKIRALADEFEKEWGPSPLGELEARVVAALRQLAEEREHFEWLEKQSGYLFTPMRGEGWAWYGNDGRSYNGSTLRELIAAATRAEAARLAERTK